MLSMNTKYHHKKHCMQKNKWKENGKLNEKEKKKKENKKQSHSDQLVNK